MIIKKFIIDNQMLIFLHIIIFEIIFLILPYYWQVSDVEKSYSYLLQFSAIFSAIVITAIISKVFSQRQENSNRKEEIIKLSNKVSDLRRIAKILIDNDNIWPKGLKNKINTTFKDLTYEVLIDQSHEVGSPADKLINLYVSDRAVNETIGNLFLALKSLQGDVKEKNLFLYTNYDFNYIYSFKIINLWLNFNTANSLWYSFAHRYSTINTQLLLSNLSADSNKNIRQFAKKINIEKYSDDSIPMNKLLSEIGTDFDTLYLEKLRYLLFENRVILPKSLSYLLNSMLVIMFSGAVIPILLQSMNVFNQFFIRFDLGIFFSCIIVLLFRFRKILKNELEVF
jgi:hypothetical protein